MEATYSGLRSMPGLSSLWRVKNSARSKLFDPGKLCGPINDIRSSMSWLHGYNTIVHDFPKISGKLSVCANSGYQALFSRVGRAWEWGYTTSRACYMYCYVWKSSSPVVQSRIYRHSHHMVSNLSNQRISQSGVSNALPLLAKLLDYETSQCQDIPKSNWRESDSHVTNSPTVDICKHTHTHTHQGFI